MRLSSQAGKILVLWGYIDPTDPGRLCGNKLKAVAMRMEGDSVYYAGGMLLDSV